jgi:acyl transferase domain-containing protein
VEAHGTGTPLGDSIEANALMATYGRARDVDHPLWLGTIKANIGHPQAASGVVGVIKMAMAMRHGRLPRTLHAAHPSPHVDWQASAVRLLTETMPWPETGRPRRAGVSSFGGTGTKVHVILEEAPSRSAVHPADRPPHPSVLGMMAGALPCVLSGRTAPALHAQAQRLADYLASRPEADLADVAWSLASRSAFPHRAVVMAADREGLLSGLEALTRAEPCGHVIAGTAPNSAGAAFLFSGSGDSQLTLARDLYAASPIFADALETVCAPLDLQLKESLPAAVFAAGASVSAGLLQQPAYAEAASFAAQVAFCRLLQAWGVTIDLAVCRARGDIAAAHVAGVLSFEQAATLIAARARLTHSLAPDFRRIAGGMSLRSPRMPVVSAQTGKVISRQDMAAAEFWLSAAADQDAGSELPPRQPEAIAALFHMGHGAWGGTAHGHPAMRGLATMLAEAHVRGVDVDWPVALSGSGARLIDLPTYAFQHDTFWLASPAPARKP